MVKKKLSGVKVVKATPGNILDVFDLYKRQWKEKPQLTPQQEKEYYWQLIEELASPSQVVLLMQKGARFLGFIHSFVVPKPNGQPPVLFVKTVYVLDSKRKRGNAKLLIDELVFMAGGFGIKKFDFVCDDEQVEYWSKKRKATKVANHMTFEV